MALVSVDENNSRLRIVKNDSDSKCSSDLNCNGIVSSNILNNVLNGELVTVLKLTDLKLIELPEELPELVHLYEINLSGNLLQTLPAKLMNAKNLRILNLSNNEFSTLPECLTFGLRTLKYLNLANNYLRDFNVPPASLPLLKELYLAYNSIEKFPPWLLSDYVFMLDVLDISFNACFEMNKDFKAPAKNRISGNIRSLKLRNTNFTIVSLGLLLYFPSLISLDVSNCCNDVSKDRRLLKNYVSEFALGYLPPQLEELYGQDIDLVSAPNIASLKKLKTLDLSANSLYWWPADENLAPNLQYIDLSQTRLLNVPDSIGNLESLTHVMLSGNDISSLPSSFHLLINLEVLDLYNNSLETMPELGNFSRLQGLDLWLNYFKPSLGTLNDEDLNYEELKNMLRKKFGFQGRKDTTKEVIEESPFTERSSSIYSTSPDVSFPMPEARNFSRSEEEEDWDVHCYSDDWFDPTADQSYKNEMYREIQNRDFGKNCLKYCPPEIQHSPHLFQPYAERITSECWKERRMFREEDCSMVEGQFDDA